jgi:hypothetical protein
MQASVRLEHELLAVESERDVWCMLELVARHAPQTAERKPLSIAHVIDRSGSMASAAVTRERRVPGRAHVPADASRS